MSQPSIAELISEGYDLAMSNCRKYLGRDPTDEELEDEYEGLCDD